MYPPTPLFEIYPVLRESSGIQTMGTGTAFNPSDRWRPRAPDAQCTGMGQIGQILANPQHWALLVGLTRHSGSGSHGMHCEGEKPATNEQ